MEHQLTAVRFRYRKVGDVAQAKSFDFDTASPPRKPGEIWTEEQGSHIWVCLAVAGIQDDIDQKLNDLRERADGWLREKYPGIKIIE